MFAGPNGSGKTTLKSYLQDINFGRYVNPDEIEREVRDSGVLDLRQFGVRPSMEEVTEFFSKSTLSPDAERRIRLKGSHLDFREMPVDSYVASAIADFLRQCLIRSKLSFTFETVMSHPGKLEFLARARQVNYRTYLYYVATDDPSINVSRVRNRVALGSHDVSEEKIRSRYVRSLALLKSAIALTSRAYIFDNSGEGDQTWLAEITDGTELELKSDRIPAWFRRAVLDQASP
jgi:predicted ABC-type ATPase